MENKKYEESTCKITAEQLNSVSGGEEDVIEEEDQGTEQQSTEQYIPLKRQKRES